jgi:cytochrome b pre-mRNA-processing protein 3
MLAWLKQLRNRRQTARSLYGSIVTQARSAGFYARWGVPDTLEGRFEMIALHLVLVLRRLAEEGEPGHRLARELTEAFAVDVDDTLREMTIGDMAVPREVKRAVAVLHDRYATYGAALDAAPSGDNLTAALRARLAELSRADNVDAASLGQYMADTAHSLRRQAGNDLLAGRLAWPQTTSGK